MGKDQHVTPRPDGKWQHKGAGNTRATRVFDTQQEAIESARATAKNEGGEVVIHAATGRIRQKNTYKKTPKKKEK